MRIGVPKEIKNHEYRVGLTPASIAELVAAGHEAVVETKAGSGIDCPQMTPELAYKCFAYMRYIGFLPSPEEQVAGLGARSLA